MSTAISLHAVDYPRQAGTVHAIRHTVFVLGQGIDPALEQDSHDASAVHVLAMDAEGHLTYLADGNWRLAHTQELFPEVVFLKTRESG